MTLNASAALADDVVFQSQVRVAALGYALTVIPEAVSPHQQVYAKRQNLALAVTADGCQARLTQMVWALASTAGFAAIVNDTQDANDAAINSAMVSQWNTIAGVTAEDLDN